MGHDWSSHDGVWVPADNEVWVCACGGWWDFAQFGRVYRSTEEKRCERNSSAQLDVVRLGRQGHEFRPHLSYLSLDWVEVLAGMVVVP